jgi:hypothetical protein
MRHGRRSGHAAAEFAASTGAFQHIAVFCDVAFNHDTFACDAGAGADAASRSEPEASSGYDRITDDAPASGGKDADQ